MAAIDTAGISQAASAASKPSDRGWFYGLLVMVTLAPLLFFPVFHTLPEEGRPDTLVQTRQFLLILSTMHVALTGYFYIDREYRAYVFGRWWYYVALPIAVIAACAFVTARLGDRGLLYLMLFYHAWLLFHYGRQNYGIYAFAGSSYGASRPHWLERAAFHLAPLGALIGAYADLPEFRQSYLRWAETANALGLAVYGVAGAAALISVLGRIRSRDYASAGFLALLYAFWAPTFLFQGYGKAIMGYAVAHALQYFVFMYFTATGDERAARKNVVALGVTAVLLWIVIWLTREREMWGGWVIYVVGAELGLIMWHFIVDAGLWKLSSPWQRGQVKQRFASIFSVSK